VKSLPSSPPTLAVEFMGSAVGAPREPDGSFAGPVVPEGTQAGKALFGMFTEFEKDRRPEGISAA
jgi:hypothetical protein